MSLSETVTMRLLIFKDKIFLYEDQIYPSRKEKLIMSHVVPYLSFFVLAQSSLIFSISTSHILFEIKILLTVA